MNEPMIGGNVPEEVVQEFADSLEEEAAAWEVANLEAFQGRSTPSDTRTAEVTDGNNAGN